MNRPNEVRITKAKQLLVEGRTPQIFFKAFLEHLKISDVDVQDFRGISQLKGFLETFVQQAEFKNIVKSYAIVRDAEDNPASQGFESVCNSIQAAGHAPPNKISVFTNNSPKIGVFILPDCSEPGMLESVCLASVMTTELANCINNFLKCAQASGIAYPKNETKAKTRAYLATADIAEAQVGRAAQAGLWRWDQPAFDQLKSFLQAL